MTIPSITALPAAPDPFNDSASDFSLKAAAFVLAQVALPAEMNAFATAANALAVEVDADAATASSAAATASAAAAAASAGVGAISWVSGTTYAINDLRVSPADGRTYRRRTAGAGTTDPSGDTTNWVLISNGAFPVIKVSDRKASGTAGATTVTTTITSTREFNTVDHNTIAGASLAADQVTLPAGTYDVFIRSPFNSVNLVQTFLYNTSDAAYTLVGSCTKATASHPIPDSIIQGRFTIAAAKNFKVRYYCQTGIAGGAGLAVSSGQGELYAEATFTKVA